MPLPSASCTKRPTTGVSVPCGALTSAGDPAGDEGCLSLCARAGVATSSPMAAAIVRRELVMNDRFLCSAVYPTRLPPQSVTVAPGLSRPTEALKLFPRVQGAAAKKNGSRLMQAALADTFHPHRRSGRSLP